MLVDEALAIPDAVEAAESRRDRLGLIGIGARVNRWRRLRAGFVAALERRAGLLRLLLLEPAEPGAERAEPRGLAAGDPFLPELECRLVQGVVPPGLADEATEEVECRRGQLRARRGWQRADDARFKRSADVGVTASVVGLVR